MKKKFSEVSESSGMSKIWMGTKHGIKKFGVTATFWTSVSRAEKHFEPNYYWILNWYLSLWTSEPLWTLVSQSEHNLFSKMEMQWKSGKKFPSDDQMKDTNTPFFRNKVKLSFSELEDQRDMPNWDQERIYWKEEIILSFISFSLVLILWV